MNLETAADQIKFDIVREYEDALNNIITERNDLLSKDPDIREQAIQNLSDLMKEHFPAGTNGINAIESLRGIIDDPKLFVQFKQISQENADTCVRPLIIDWINNNAPDIAEKFGSTNMDQEKEDKVVPPNSEMGQSENYSMQELAEFIRSFYDKDTNTFPKGPEGVSIMVGKKFGENAEMLARRMVEMLAPMQDGDKVSEINRIKELAGLH
jgi:hypothetical protein